MIERVVLATDGSESAAGAIAMALDLADRFDARVDALYVVDQEEIDTSPDDVRDEIAAALRTQGEAALADVQSASGNGVRTVVREGRPAVEIIAYVRESDADLLAVGTRGRHGEHRYLLGSVADAIVRTAPVPVLAVRQLEAAGSTGS